MRRPVTSGWLTQLNSLKTCMTVFLAIACCLNAAAQTALQKQVTIEGNNIALLQVFKSIKKQTGITFFYSNQLLNDAEKVTLSFRQAKLEEVLDFLFKGRNIQYTLRENRLLLSEKAAESKKVQEPSKTEDLAAIYQSVVKGQVMGEDGKTIPGVTVQVKNKDQFATTDELGTFFIKSSPGDTLAFSMVGMITLEQRVNNRIVKVTLVQKTDKLNDVVVVGYGKQKKVTVTGAVASVNMEDMRTPVPSLTNALAGKVAGIVSVQSSGEPGYDNSTFTIRGIGTFTGTASPLIIVDGVQREDVNSTYGGAFNNIDPEDISSISLLKDASSTAIYGAKGANGVLLITTKRGAAGKARIYFKAETGATSFTQTPEMLDGVNYMKLLNEARTNMGNSPLYSEEQIQKTASGLDAYMYPNVNWMDAVYKKNSSLTNANLNISGGGETVRYYLSASFYNQEGQYNVKKLNDYNPNLNFKRYDFRTNVDVNITRTTLLQMNLAAMLVNSRYPGISASKLWYLTYATTPVAFPVQYPDGKWAGPGNNGGSNPFNEVQNNGYSTEFRPSVQSVFTVTQKLDSWVKGLDVSGRFSFDSYGVFNNRRSGVNDLFLATGRDSEGKLHYTQTRTGQQFLGYSQSSSGERVMYLEATLNYNRNFGAHQFGGLLLYNMRNRLVSTAGDVIGSIPYRNQALAGRFTYAYDSKYLLEMNAGYTGSENFERGQKFGIFPSVSAGWVISRENFLDKLSPSISFLKLRASYGLVGNDNIGAGNRFPYHTQIGGGYAAGFGPNGSLRYGSTENQIGVEKLTWEKSYKANLGLEVGLFNTVNIILDAFKERRSDILIKRASISSIAGYSNAAIFANIGEMDNKGFEGSIEYNQKFGAVQLRLYGNATYTINKIVFQDEPLRKYSYQRGTGHRFGEFTGYVAEGLFNNQDEIDANAEQKFSQVAPGDIRYRNVNAKDDDIIDAYDYQYLGKSWFPSWLYGAGFSVNYKKFDLSLFFQGVADAGIMANGSYIDGSGWGASGVGVIPFSGIGTYPNNTMSKALDRWTADNPNQDAYYPRLTLGSVNDNNYLNSTRWLKDGSYVRLKQASIGYSFLTPALKKSGFAGLYLYVSGQNLLTFSKFKLWDPELGSNGAKYPITRMVTIGIRAQF
ncbi:TonB-dependent receptor [Paraflavitalea sp. CAU 1676]|uniref:TonB-dependent receptor n=1 Tax=Paraflavitalea sp. CAU 1676 TaxID=3032598 RepID=UPI0023DA9CC5|nr:TonB-dependent receptor [Paraflavitalea sp. CAU 1676]MDF2190146.1 TonB-dependent receptor [Paraflavitalea sp. CAU 1676]